MGAFLIAQFVKNLPAMQERPVWFLGWEDCWRRDRLPTPVFLGFPGGSAGKECACNVGDLGSKPGLGRSPGEGISYLHQYFGLENSVDCISMGLQRDGHDWVTFTFIFFQFPECLEALEYPWGIKIGVVWGVKTICKRKLSLLPWNCMQLFWRIL